MVDDFLKARQAGAIGLDIGCGNGKYLPVNKNVFIVASDRYKTSSTFSVLAVLTSPCSSAQLAKIARQHQPHSVLVADTIALPHPDLSFDFAISIAVIHHLSTTERRVDAIRAILQKLRPAGQALFFVWALEQKDSRRGWDDGHEQDVLVPWVLKPQSNACDPPVTYERYYHLYRKGELQKDICTAGGKVIESGYDRDNWWCIAQH